MVDTIIFALILVLFTHDHSYDKLTVEGTSLSMQDCDLLAIDLIYVLTRRHFAII